MGKAYKLVIPGTLPNLNDYIEAERSHRQKAAAMKRKCEQMIILHIKNQMRGCSFKKPVRIKYTWYEKDRRRDLDNVAFAKKFVQDALVKAKVIQNDSQKWVVGF
jgi:Holliday junction resolvase RusA-like endonuclease